MCKIFRQKHAVEHYEFNLKEHSSYIRKNIYEKETGLYLRQKPAQVGVHWALDIKGPSANIVLVSLSRAVTSV
jgi:hypothetical protein